MSLVVLCGQRLSHALDTGISVESEICARLRTAVLLAISSNVNVNDPLAVRRKVSMHVTEYAHKYERILLSMC